MGFCKPRDPAGVGTGSAAAAPPVIASGIGRFSHKTSRIRQSGKIVDPRGTHEATGQPTRATGAVIGSFVNFARGGMMPRFVPDFKWMAPAKDLDYELVKAINTARLVMKRRNVRMSAQYENIIRNLHEQVRRSN